MCLHDEHLFHGLYHAVPIAGLPLSHQVLRAGTVEYSVLGIVKPETLLVFYPISIFLFLLKRILILSIVSVCPASLAAPDSSEVVFDNEL